MAEVGIARHELVYTSVFQLPLSPAMSSSTIASSPALHTLITLHMPSAAPPVHPTCTALQYAPREHIALNSSICSCTQSLPYTDPSEGPHADSAHGPLVQHLVFQREVPRNVLPRFVALRGHDGLKWLALVLGTRTMQGVPGSGPSSTSSWLPKTR